VQGVALPEQGTATPFYELTADTQSAKAFHDALAAHIRNNPNGAAVTLHSVTEYKDMRLFVTQDGLAGYAIRDGNELVSVYSQTGMRRGEAIVASAVAQGAKRLDAYAVPKLGEPNDTEGYLPKLYHESGFVEVARVAINPAYDPPKGAMWVSIMARLATPPDEVRMFDMNGYNEALEYRDSLLLGRNRE
jgi:hypothetical protein